MTSRPALSTSPIGFVPFQCIVPGVSQTIALTSSSVQSSAFAATTSIIRLFATKDCFLIFGANPTATTAGVFIPGGIIQFLGVVPGQKLAAIESIADGSLYVTEGAGA